MRKVRLSPSSPLRGFKISIDSEKMYDSRQQLELSESEPDLVTADIQSHHPPQLLCRHKEGVSTNKYLENMSETSKAEDDNQENQKR